MSCFAKNFSITSSNNIEPLRLRYIDKDAKSTNLLSVIVNRRNDLIRFKAEKLLSHWFFLGAILGASVKKRMSPDVDSLN